MKTSRFSEPQILAILRQAEGGVPVPELWREHGMSTASLCKWRAKYGGMDASMISQMKALEDENFVARPHFTSGALVELLPDWKPKSFPLHLVYPASRFPSLKLRAFSDWVAALFDSYEKKAR